MSEEQRGPQEQTLEIQATEAEQAQERPWQPPDSETLRKIIEGLLIAAGKPLPLNAMLELFEPHERPEREAILDVLQQIAEHCAECGYELKEVASGYRFQVRQALSPWVSRLFEERPQRYTRALLETLALIAYRQPITRGDIEEIRGVSVSSTIIRTLLDREWIRVVGHRDVPGRPAMFATTRQFLDYFDLKSLQDLPPLSEIRDLDQLNAELSFDDERREMRVLDLPDDEDEAPLIGADEEEGERVRYAEDELPDEEEAMALATRPLDDILATHDDSDDSADEAQSENN